MASPRLLFSLCVALLWVAAYSQEVKASDLTGTYAARWIASKGTKLSSEAKKTKSILEKETRLILEPRGTYVLKTGKVARVGTWHVAKGKLSLSPEARLGQRAAVVVYYISEDRKVLTPRESSAKSPFIRFQRISRSVKL